MFDRSLRGIFSKMYEKTLHSHFHAVKLFYGLFMKYFSGYVSVKMNLVFSEIIQLQF